MDSVKADKWDFRPCPLRQRPQYCKICRFSYPIIVSLAVSSIESHVVVCSTREICVILIDGGTFGRHIALNLNLATGQYITRISWAPNSGSIVGAASNAGLKIFDLSKDIISPIYNFKPASANGIITDFTFMFYKKQLCVIALTNEGMIYIQELDNESTAEKQGEFFLSNILEFDENIGGSGVSIHFSLPTETLYVTFQNKAKEYSTVAFPQISQIDSKWSAPQFIGGLPIHNTVLIIQEHLGIQDIIKF
jgi:hypothetical protein